MKILQLNIWMGRMASGLVRYIQKVQPDVICMQEVFNADFSVALPDAMFDILQRLKEATGLQYEYFSSDYTIDVSGGEAPYGNAILSKLPFETTKTVRVEHTPQRHVTVASYQHNTTNLQVVTVQKDGVLWTIANHHGHHDPDPNGSDASVTAMWRVADELQGTQGPLVLCGDLNVWPDSPAMRVFDGRLDDIVARSDVKTTLSHLSVDRDVVCDHILVNDAVVVEQFRVDDVLVSDHYPLVLEAGANV